MKKIKLLSIVAILAMVFLGYSCSDDDNDIVVNNVKVTLSYSEGIDAQEGVSIKASGAGTEYELKTDTMGSVVFQLPVGSYEFSASETRTGSGEVAYNGLLSKVIGSEWNETTVLSMEMTGSLKSQLIIKELYMGGCPADDGGKSYSYGQYITLYNNSTENVDLQNLCIGTLMTNSNAMKYDINDGDIEAHWFKEDWTPVSVGYFYFSNQTILEPGKQIVVAISGGIDHTQTYDQCVDLSDKDNYVCYDVDKFNFVKAYPAPSSNIDPSHYLKGVKYGLGSAVSYSKLSPAVFLFYPQGQTPLEYGMDASDYDYWRDKTNFPRKKVPASWTVDAIEAFASGKESDNKKRLNPKIDAGYVYQISKKGYTLYRNVDKESTEAIEGNKDKLIYAYAMGTDEIESKHGTTDPSGIDAEASIANGAVIIFKDTNNSANDFHLRQKSSLRE